MISPLTPLELPITITSSAARRTTTCGGARGEAGGRGVVRSGARGRWGCEGQAVCTAPGSRQTPQRQPLRSATGPGPALGSPAHSSPAHSSSPGPHLAVAPQVHDHLVAGAHAPVQQRV
jgi:hypothetical protein